MNGVAICAMGAAGPVTAGVVTARRDGAATKMKMATTWPSSRVVVRRRVKCDTRTFAFGVNSRVAIGSLDGRWGAALRTTRLRAAPGEVEQLERQVRSDPVVSTPPFKEDGEMNGDADTDTSPEVPANASSSATSSEASTTTSSSSTSNKQNSRQPLGPWRRFLLKMKLYFLLTTGWSVKFFKGLFASKAFITVFTVFVVLSGAVTVKAGLAKRTALKASAPVSVLYSSFIKDLSLKKVKQVRFEEGTSRILYELQPGVSSSAPGKTTATGKTIPAATSTATISTKEKGTILATKRIPDEKLMGRMESAGVDFGSIAAPPSSYLSKGALTAMALWTPLIPLYFVMRNMANKQNGGDAAKKAKSRGQVDDAQRVTFADVAGVDEAKAELVELVEMLKSADKYKGVRNRLPTGCLLVGPPGTGKTLLAKAVAGEANVPFFSVAASEFVELFVGRGAARVRELFGEARKASPAVIFIDELDAIGARRGAGLNEERDQTLNQMLVEMDGFNKPGGVLVLAATNRAEALDPALLRPGRLTRRVFVGPPDFNGRVQIMKVHLRGVETFESLEITVDAIARITPGFTGAELANVVNEACLLAARDDREIITVDDLISGAERTKNGVGVGKGAATVLSRLRELVTRNDGWGGGPPGGDGSSSGGSGPENVPDGNRKQGVGLSMPPT